MKIKFKLLVEIEPSSKEEARYALLRMIKRIEDSSEQPIFKVRIVEDCP